MVPCDGYATGEIQGKVQTCRSLQTILHIFLERIERQAASRDLHLVLKFSADDGLAITKGSIAALLLIF